MTNTLTIQVDDAAVQAAFRRLMDFGRDASPMFAEISEHLLESTQRRFASSTAPDGTPWVALRDGSGRRPLLDTGTLRDQIYPSHGRAHAQISATAAYARWHQEGTDPYVILPKNKKALAFGGAVSIIAGPRKGQADKGTVVGKVNHPGLPARPFIGVSDHDWVDIRAIAGAYLDDLASR